MSGERHVSRHQCRGVSCRLIVEQAVIVEMKAVQKLDLSHEKQLLNYLRATNLEVGLLLNFGPSAQIRRLVLENERKRLRRSAAGSSRTT